MDIKNMIIKTIKQILFIIISINLIISPLLADEILASQDQTNSSSDSKTAKVEVDLSNGAITGSASSTLSNSSKRYYDKYVK
jgi:hypothetical protein